MDPIPLPKPECKSSKSIVEAIRGMLELAHEEDLTYAEIVVHIRGGDTRRISISSL